MVRRTLQEIGREARQLRRRHGAGVHLPAGLRKTAAQLAASHDDEAITQELRISRETLRRWKLRWPTGLRIEAPRSGVAKPGKAKPKRIDFVEIKADQPRHVVQPAMPPTSSVEVTRPDGSMVRVTGELASTVAAAMLAEIQPLRRKS